jgi:ArsR family transcriptional regulator
MGKAAFHRGTTTRTLQASTRMMRALAHPLRLRILERLARHVSPLAVGELVDLLREPQHTVSQHLNLLYLHGILARRQEGRRVYYHVRDGEALKLLQWVQQYRRDEGGFQDGEAI